MNFTDHMKDQTFEICKLNVNRISESINQLEEFCSVGNADSTNQFHWYMEQYFQINLPINTQYKVESEPITS